jgi:UrcA family protein
MIRTVPLPALLALLATTPALAEPYVWQTGDGFTIRATGLDLGTTDGREALLKRVEHAAARLCRPEPLRAERKACQERTRAEVIAGAPASLAAPIRTALAARERTRLASR